MTYGENVREIPLDFIKREQNLWDVAYFMLKHWNCGEVGINTKYLSGYIADIQCFEHGIFVDFESNY